MNFLKKLIQFLKDVANDERIPERDKKVLLAMIVLLVSPIDIIPDWIPILGMLDDIIILSIVLDYFFRVLDSTIILSHYPWGMKSFAVLKRVNGIFSFFVPNFLTKKIWKYVPPAY
ncbi:MAG: DUF1232 domain-containing protein [Bacteriovoracaceae bacterium]